MYLSDIQIYKVGNYQNTVEEQHLYLLDLEQSKYLMTYWENISDLFCLKLPKKFNFLNISKFNIRLGDYNGEQFETSKIGGISTFKRNDFDFNEFTELKDKEKNLFSLELVRDSLIKVCQMHGISINVIGVINDICDSIISEEFSLTREFSKTTKWNKSRSLRAVTYMHYKQGGIDVFVEIIDKNGSAKLKTLVLENCFWEFIWFEVWKGYWLGSDFILEDKNKKIIKKISLLREST